MNEPLKWMLIGSATTSSIIALYLFMLCYLNRLPRPYLDFWVNCGLFQISTELMNERMTFLMRDITHVCLRVTLLNRWGFQFRLYDLLK